MTPLEMLSSYYDDFTKAEQRAAKYIMDRPQAAYSENLTTIAQNSNSSNAAVIRMCQKIGFAGFSDFRYALTRQMMAGEADTGSSVQDPYQKIISIYNSYINKIPVMVPREQIILLARKIVEARRINIMGINRTALSAQQLSHRLERLGVYNKFTDDKCVMMEDADILGTGDLMILFSMNGRGCVEYGQIITEYKEQNCHTVLITMNSKLKIAQLPDQTITLPCISRDYDRNFYEDQIIVYLFIEFLLYEVAKIQGNLANTMPEAD